jgi:hypothetical protein
MTGKKASQIDGAELRRLAEERLRENRVTAHPPGTAEDPLRLHHELQVHQVELEMQNAELRKTMDDLETALDESSTSTISSRLAALPLTAKELSVGLT